MEFTTRLTAIDTGLIADRIEEFAPQHIFDIHAHLINNTHFGKNHLSYLPSDAILAISEYRMALNEWLPGARIDGLFFGFPVTDSDRQQVNSWVTSQVIADDGASYGLILAGPSDNPDLVRALISDSRMVGIKPYYLFQSDASNSEPPIENFAPEWMWDVCHSAKGILMLHMMSSGLADVSNVSVISRFSGKYPDCQVVLAHCARAFNYRTLRRGIEYIADLPNVFLDTSAITEPYTFRTVLDRLGHKRLLFGSDFPICNIRGRSTTLGATAFRWNYAGSSDAGDDSSLALNGIESVASLIDACEDNGLGRTEIADIFQLNARRLLASHARPASPTP